MDQRSPGYEHVTSREALAWAAGFFDGEGSTYVCGGESMALTIQQVIREPLERFRVAIGYEEAPIYGPYMYKDNRSGRYEVRVTGVTRVNAALDLLWPWLGAAKREQAESVRAAWAARPLRGPRVRDPSTFIPEREQVRQRVRKWRAEHPELTNERNRTTDQNRRARVFEHYGKVCACCGSSEQLRIDRVDSAGRVHHFYAWLVSNGFPSGFQTLCYQCLVSKRINGKCVRPHSEGLLRALELERARCEGDSGVSPA